MRFGRKRQGREAACSHKEKACADCTRRCSLIHGKNKNLSPCVASFFKIMIGDRWKDYMPLPPKFARTIPGLENKKTMLIDSDGKSWEVLICKVGGYISFQRGWNAFVLAHGLRVGYVLCFEYVVMHFVVKIYNETACELVGYSGKNCHQSKRSRTNSSSSDSKDSSCFIMDEIPVKKKQCSGSRGAEEKCKGRGKSSDKGKSPIEAEIHFTSTTNLAKDTTWYSVKESTRKQCPESRDKSQSQGKSPMVAKNTFYANNSHGKNSRPFTVDEGFLKGECSGYRFDVDKRQSQGKANDMGKSQTVGENTFSSENIYGKSLPTRKAGCSEESLNTIDRGLKEKQGKDKNHILDSSNFGTGWNRSGVAPPVEVVIVDEEDAVPDKRNCHSATSKPPLAPSVVRPIEREIIDAVRSSVNVKKCQVSPESDNAHSKPLAQNYPVTRFEKEGALPIDSVRSLQQTVKPGLANKEDGPVAAPSNTCDIQMNFKGHCSENVSKLLPDKRNCHGETSKPPLAPSAARPVKREIVYALGSSVNVKKCKVSSASDNAHSKPLAQNHPVTRFEKEGALLIDSRKSLQQTVIGALNLSMPNLQSGETMLTAKAEPKATFKSEPVRITKTAPMAIVKSEPVRINNTEPTATVKSKQTETASLKLVNYEEMLRGTGIVKIEPPDCSFGVSSLTTLTAFSVVMIINLRSLELPARLPSTNKERHAMKRKLVYLCDPLTRLWPVLYHDRPELKLLTSGWQAFCEANDIQPGDECTFGSENGPKDIYKVSVLKSRIIPQP